MIPAFSSKNVGPEKVVRNLSGSLYNIQNYIWWFHNMKTLSIMLILVTSLQQNTYLTANLLNKFIDIIKFVNRFLNYTTDTQC